MFIPESKDVSCWGCYANSTLGLWPLFSKYLRKKQR